MWCCWLTSRQNNKTPEEQVEGLLDELQKKDCFDIFCEALTADGQEHIVKKFLKRPKTHVVSDSTASPASASLKRSESVLGPSETTDSSAGQELTNQRYTSIVLRESDNKYVCIRYDNDVTPSKRSRISENSVAVYEPDETRYAMKHFVAEPAELAEKGVMVQAPMGKNPSPVLVMDNPQSILQNPNISDPSRYMAAFSPQKPSLLHSENRQLDDSIGHSKLQAVVTPTKDPSYKINEPGDLTRTDIQNLLRPNISNTHSSLLNHINAEHHGRFVK